MKAVLARPGLAGWLAARCQAPRLAALLLVLLIGEDIMFGQPGTIGSRAVLVGAATLHPLVTGSSRTAAARPRQLAPGSNMGVGSLAP